MHQQTSSSTPCPVSAVPIEIRLLLLTLRRSTHIIPRPYRCAFIPLTLDKAHHNVSQHETSSIPTTNLERIDELTMGQTIPSPSRSARIGRRSAVVWWPAGIGRKPLDTAWSRTGPRFRAPSLESSDCRGQARTNGHGA